MRALNMEFARISQMKTSSNDHTKCYTFSRLTKVLFYGFEKKIWLEIGQSSTYLIIDQI